MQIKSLQEKTIVDKKEELRVQEGDSDSLVSYVCDVNGWSFVKNSFLLLKIYYKETQIRHLRVKIVITLNI